MLKARCTNFMALSHHHEIVRYDTFCKNSFIIWIIFWWMVMCGLRCRCRCRFFNSISFFMCAFVLRFCGRFSCFAVNQSFLLMEIIRFREQRKKRWQKILNLNATHSNRSYCLNTNQYERVPVRTLFWITHNTNLTIRNTLQLYGFRNNVPAGMRLYSLVHICFLGML